MYLFNQNQNISIQIYSGLFYIISKICFPTNDSNPDLVLLLPHHVKYLLISYILQVCYVTTFEWARSGISHLRQSHVIQYIAAGLLPAKHNSTMIMSMINVAFCCHHQYGEIVAKNCTNLFAKKTETLWIIHVQISTVLSYSFSGKVFLYGTRGLPDFAVCLPPT